MILGDFAMDGEIAQGVPQALGPMTEHERAEILYEVREHRRKIDGLEKAVFLGNGHKPLMERATSLEAEVDAIKKNMDEIRGDVHALRKGQNAIVWKVLCGMAALLAVFIGAILTFVLK